MLEGVHPLQRTYDRWAQLVPDDVAVEQCYWERRHAIWRALQQCRTRHERAHLTKAVCKQCNISKSRVYELIKQAERDVSRGRRSPAQKYIETPQFVLRPQTSVEPTLS